MDTVEARLTEVERKVESLVEVCAAVADDTLRMCLALDELHRVGKLPAVPWDVATAQVELHHAIQAAKQDLTDAQGVAASKRVEELRLEVARLREVYRASLTG